MGTSDEGHAEAPAHGEAASLECTPPRGDELAWLVSRVGACGAAVHDEENEWVVRAAEPDAPVLAHGPAPHACAQAQCQVGGQVAQRRALLTVDVLGAAGEVPVMRLFGTNGPDGELGFVPLWVERRAQVDSMDVEPPFELAPHLCGGDVVLKIAAGSREEEPSAATQAAAGKLVWGADGWEVEPAPNAEGCQPVLD